MRTLKKSISIAVVSFMLAAGISTFSVAQAVMTPESGGACPAGEC